MNRTILLLAGLLFFSLPSFAQDKPVDPQIVAINQKIAENPSDPKNYDTRSALYFKAGNKVAALEDMKKGYELETDKDQKSLRLMEIQDFMKQK